MGQGRVGDRGIIHSMRTIILLLAGLVLVAPVQAGTGVGRIAIFSDDALSNGELTDDSLRLVDIYIGHVDHIGVTGSQFKVEPTEGFTGTWISETSPWAPFTIGQSLSGISISYQACIDDDILVVKATYWLQGTSSPCSGLRVTRVPPTPQVLCVGCNFVELPCDPPGDLRVNCPVSTQTTTWGRVKALYR